MPEGLGKTGQTSRSTPQEQSDTEPDGPVAVVGQKPGKQACQRVQVVEDRARDYLIGETTPTVVVLAHVQGLVKGIVGFFRELQDFQVFTVSLAEPGREIVTAQRLHTDMMTGKATGVSEASHKN